MTAIKLIDKIIDFISLESDEEKWNFDALKNNPSKLIRLRKIEALLKAFVPDVYQGNHLGFAMSSILSGRFINSRHLEQYAPLFDLMDSTLERIKSSKDSWELRHLSINYAQIIDRKIKINALLKGSNAMEGSYHYAYSYFVTKDIFNPSKIEKIDHFLSLALDPDGKNFSKEELIRLYNYPTESTLDVDLDNY